MKKHLCSLLSLFCLLFLSACQSKPKQLWSFTTGAPIYASPSVAKDHLIVPSQDHYLYALDLQSGKQIWKTNLGEQIPSKPLIRGKSIFVGGGTGEFVQIDADSGKILWKFKTGGLIQYDACADDSGIYFGSGDFTFYKLDYSGQKLWEFKTYKTFWGTCVFYEDVVITSSWDKNYYGLDRTTGEVKWKVPTGIFNFGGPELVGKDVYFATHSTMFRIEAKTGKLISTAKSSYLTNVVSWKNFLWTNEKGFTKRQLDLAPVGSVDFNSRTGFRPVSSDHYIITAADSKSLIGVSEDLKIVWKYKGNDAFFAPGIVYKNVYYTGNRDHNVYALQLPAN